MSISSQFYRPVLIYDNKCTSCIKFAKLATQSSRGWIKTIGHFDSVEIIDIRTKIFPEDYNPTKMFWLINKKGIYGGRKALIPLFIEIITGILNGGTINNDNFRLICNYIDKQSCNTSINILKRSFNLFKRGEHFSFK